MGAHWHRIPMPTIATLEFRRLTELILTYAKLLGAGEATSIQLTKNLCTKPHRDANNKGPSYIFGLGDWKNGETFVEDANGTDEYELGEDIPNIGRQGTVLRGYKKDIHTLQKFDGTKTHCTTKFTGTRYCIVLFCIKSKYQETPALVRAFLQKLGFPLPASDTDFDSKIDQECEYLANLLVQGRKVEDELGRHTPPAGPRKRKHEGPGQAATQPEAAFGARQGQPATGLRRFLSMPAIEAKEQWTESNVMILKDMKSPTRKASWEVIAKKLGKSKESLKKKWEELCRS